jgi:hypothetical protein
VALIGTEMGGEVVDGFLDGHPRTQTPQMLNQELSLQRRRMVIVDPGSFLVRQLRLVAVVGVVLEKGNPTVETLDNGFSDGGLA